MARARRLEKSERQVLKALRFLDAWRITVSSDGLILIQPAGPSLRLVEFVALVRRLRDCCDDTFPCEILFDLNHVHVVGAPQSIIERLMGHFARSVNARCTVVGYGSG